MTDAKVKKEPKKAPKEFFSKIQQEISKGRQSATCETHYKIQTGALKGAKLRTLVKSDSYDFQSYAFAEIWKNDDLKWTRICAIPYSAMSTKTALHAQPDLAIRHFIKDNQALLTKAEMILN